MKRILLSVITIACVLSGYAVEINSADTTLMTLEQIIAQESKSKHDNDYAKSLNSVWGKNTFLNLIYNSPHKMKSDEFPMKQEPGKFSSEYKPKWGVGLEWGHTYNFHRNPIGSVLFIGLDYTWMDLNFNKFDKENPPMEFNYDEGIHPMPWHNEKMTLSYGMSIGPSLTFYPFTSLRNSGSNKIRLQLYFHVGYSAHGALIKKAIYDGDKLKNGYAYGHGLFLGYGANLSWDFFGVGVEMRNDDNIKFKVTDKDYDTGKLKMKEQTTRLYVQFRF